MINFLKINKSLNFFDKKILKFLLNAIDLYNHQKMVIDMIDLKKLINKFTNKEVIECLKNINNLQISYKIIFAKIEYEGNFNIISGYKVLNSNKIEISFSNDFIDTFNKNSFLSEINLDIILSFNFSYSIHLYNFLVNELSDRTYTEIELIKLKNMLYISNQYDRIYDFEKYVLLPSLEEINKISDNQFYYVKMRKTKKLNSKIIGFNFFVVNKEKINKIKYILSFFDVLENFNYFIYNLSHILDILSMDELEYAIKKLKLKFQEKFEKKVFENYFLDNIDEYIDGYKNKYVLIADIKNVTSFNQYKYLIFENSYNIDSTFLFTWNEIKNINRNETFEYENSNLKIQAKYFDEGDKFIKIFKKKKL